MKKTFIITIFCLLSLFGFGQAYNMDNTPVSTCSGTFYDSQGTSNYLSGEDYTKTFTPSTAGNNLQFVFTLFTIETCCDYLSIYDGPTTAYPLIGTYTSNPGTITATNATGELTFVWHSDGSVEYAGWEASISCIPSTPSGTGDNCTSAQDLSLLTSPYSATTVGYLDDIAVCRTGYPDRIFYINVPNCWTIDIWQSSNNYDSYHYMGYGPVCPGATQLYCIDDSDTQHNSWTNSTGSSQTVWFIVDGYSGSGTFTLEWTLTGATLAAPTAGTHVPSGTQIIWNWNAVAGATGYRWSTTNNYATATDVGALTTTTETGLTCGVAYTRYVWAYDACGNSVSTSLTSTIPCAGTGDNCASAQDLSLLTSPYSATTVGYLDDIAVCRTGYPDRIFYISVPNCWTIDIWQSTNSYDSYHYMGYGPACPGATQLYCIDDSDTQHNSWTNSTGSTQTVWFIVDGYSGSGTFTLEWTLTGATLAAPTAGTHVPSGTQIIWNWNTVTGATGYRWSTTNNYATATDMGALTTTTETGLTCGVAYTRYVWAYDACGNSVSTSLTSTIPCPGVGDNCASAQNLSLLTSPYSATTIGYLDDISVCRTGYPDRIFYINVPNCNTIDIWESTNSYDEYEYMGYGNVCPGATTINCWDNDGLAHNTWINTTGSAQTVWYVQDGLSGSGTFTLEWNLTASGALAAPTAGTHVPSGTQIVWNWNTVTGATGYKWSTTNNYATAIDMGALTTTTETGLTCGVAYTRYVWAYNSCGNSVSTAISSTITCPGVGDNCASAQNLALLTSPYSGTTVGYLDDIAVCRTGYPDRIFYINVPNCFTIDIWQSINDYDSYHYMGYGPVCPGATQLFCIDDSDTQHNSWTNNTGSAQTVWFIVDGYSGSGTFTLEWTLIDNGCFGTPNNGTVTASVNPVTCAASNSLLTGNGLTTSCGITYQWQFSLTGGAPWTNIVGANNTTLTVSPLVATYYRIVTTCANSGLSAYSPGLQITSTITPPANDNCANAVNLFVNSDYNCGTVTPGTVVCATASADVIAPCWGTSDDDVWYSFVASSASHRVSLLNVAGSTTDMYHAVYSGSCGALTNISCNDADVTDLTGLTIGNTYYVRVYTYTSTPGQTSTFNVCIGTPPPPPMNDEPCNAIILPVNYGSCSYTGAYNSFATSSEVLQPGIPAPGCAGYSGGDVWFRATVPASGRLIIDMGDAGGITDAGMALYTSATNNCNNITTLVECDDDDSQNGMLSMICRAGSMCTVPGDCGQNATLTPGSTVFIRVWEPFNDTYGPFDICAYEPAAPGTPSTCANATTIASLPFSDMGQTTCCRGDDVTSLNANACVSSYMDGEDFLYQYTPATNQSIDLSITGTSSYTGVFVTDLCPTSVGVSCIGSATSSTGNPMLCGVNLTAGITYFIMIDTDPTPTCTPFNINIATSLSASCGMNYSVSSIPINFESFFGTNIVLPIDDRFCDIQIPIGFPMCYDGVQYTSLLVSSNGFLIFNPTSCTTNLPGINAAPSAYSAWSINAAIPNTTDAPRNAILFPWHDINPAIGGAISYTVQGTAPNRRFIVSFLNAPLYSCTSLLCDQQVKLFESSYNIEMHLRNKPLCSSWNGGAAILGLHNATGTAAVVPAGHNYPTQWTATNEAWRFTNNCGATCLVPLPVELTNFNGKNEGPVNKLWWSTASEKNNEYFVIEKFINGEFQEIGGVAGAGNSNLVRNYDFYDDNVTHPTSYYKLKQVDYNGGFKYSDIISVNKSIIFRQNVYPNPAIDAVNVLLGYNVESAHAVVFDNLGKEMKNSFININGSSFILDVTDLQNGMYTIKVFDSIGNEILKDKIVINRN